MFPMKPVTHEWGEAKPGPALLNTKPRRERGLVWSGAMTVSLNGIG